MPSEQQILRRELYEKDRLSKQVLEKETLIVDALDKLSIELSSFDIKKPSRDLSTALEKLANRLSDFSMEDIYADVEDSVISGLPDFRKKMQKANSKYASFLLKSQATITDVFDTMGKGLQRFKAGESLGSIFEAEAEKFGFSMKKFNKMADSISAPKKVDAAAEVGNGVIRQALPETLGNIVGGEVRDKFFDGVTVKVEIPEVSDSIPKSLDTPIPKSLDTLDVTVVSDSIPKSLDTSMDNPSENIEGLVTAIVKKMNREEKTLLSKGSVAVPLSKKERTDASLEAKLLENVGSMGLEGAGPKKSLDQFIESVDEGASYTESLFGSKSLKKAQKTSRVQVASGSKFSKALGSITKGLGKLIPFFSVLVPLFGGFLLLFAKLEGIVSDVSDALKEVGIVNFEDFNKGIDFVTKSMKQGLGKEAIKVYKATIGSFERTMNSLGVDIDKVRADALEFSQILGVDQGSIRAFYTNIAYLTEDADKIQGLSNKWMNILHSAKAPVQETTDLFNRFLAEDLVSDEDIDPFMKRIAAFTGALDPAAAESILGVLIEGQTEWQKYVPDRVLSIIEESYGGIDWETMTAGGAKSIDLLVEAITKMNPDEVTASVRGLADAFRVTPQVFKDLIKNFAPTLSDITDTSDLATEALMRQSTAKLGFLSQIERAIQPLIAPFLEAMIPLKGALTDLINWVIMLSRTIGLATTQIFKWIAPRAIKKDIQEMPGPLKMDLIDQANLKLDRWEERLLKTKEQKDKEKKVLREQPYIIKDSAGIDQWNYSKLGMELGQTVGLAVELGRASYRAFNTMEDLGFDEEGNRVSQYPREEFPLWHQLGDEFRDEFHEMFMAKPLDYFQSIPNIQVQTNLASGKILEALILEQLIRLTDTVKGQGKAKKEKPIEIQNKTTVEMGRKPVGSSLEKAASVY